ncbi:hypothetical protein G0U57_008537 [Chelydra serpentina]|uniref:HAT C-terminal dimerisation domain-containing protein n=1 Tax=Chelydra serpentina TaxID=8475 RepID=A0A8T1SGW2_CHESE|nr:hypothetical protein G0U57_008537 [Chelydra serpentina]
MPVTVSEAERSFSKMKQIKSIQISTIGQERLNSLALLATEQDLVRSLNCEDIIDDFAAFLMFFLNLFKYLFYSCMF